MSGQARKAQQSVRFVSPSVRAAQKLPANIKAQSVKNQLLRGGAKPLELEYAQFDQWLGQQGDRVSSEEVAAYLTQQGPLGRLKRLDQRGSTPDPDDSVPNYDSSDDDFDSESALKQALRKYDALPERERSLFSRPKTAEAGDEARLPAPMDRATEDHNRTWWRTAYANVTEADAHGWPDANYKEVLWFDPRESPLSRPFSFLAPPHDVVDSHQATMWARYHTNPSSIDVQNIQSDVGQKLERHAARKPLPENLRDRRQRYEAAADRLSEEAADRRDFLYTYLEQIGGGTDWLALNDVLRGERTNLIAGDQRREKMSAYLAALDPTAREALLGLWHGVETGHRNARAIRTLQDTLNRAIGAGKFRAGGAAAPNPGAHIPLVDGGAWRQIPLRMLLLESAARDGLPITFPLGTNATAVESMPRRAAARMYERDLPNELMKILRPLGGGTKAFTPPAGQRMITNYRGNTLGVKVGAEPGARAGVSVLPSRKAIEYIQKNGLDVLALMLMAGGGAAASQQQGPVTQELLK